MMSYGYMLSSLLTPGGSPLIGYLIGSLLIGFAYVLPVSTVAALLRAARSHHRPGSAPVTSMLGFWLFSLILLLASFLYAKVQPYELMAEVLLFFSNIFLVPIATGLGIARVVS